MAPYGIVSNDSYLLIPPNERTVNFEVLVKVFGSTHVCCVLVVCRHRPPRDSARSKAVTSKPSSIRFLVATKPSGPAPITATLIPKPAEP
jgi:hypothetical protein